MKKTYQNKNPIQHKDKLYIYGEHCVLSALVNNKRKIHTIYTTEKNFNLIKNKVNELNKNIPIQIQTPQSLDSMMMQDENHQGLVALVDKLPYENLKIVLNNLDNDNQEKIIFLMLDQVTDTRNIGAIIRTAVAFNVEGIIFNNTNFPQENSQMVRASVGTIEKIKLIEVSNLVNAIEVLKEDGFWVFGLDSHSKDKINHIKDFKKVVLVLGSEDRGIRDLTKKNCDMLCKIPMHNNVESLNISNACAIALYEISSK